MVHKNLMHSVDGQKARDSFITNILNTNKATGNLVSEKERVVINIDKLVPKQWLRENIRQRIRDICTLMITFVIDPSAKKLLAKSRNVTVDITWRKVRSKGQLFQGAYLRHVKNGM